MSAFPDDVVAAVLHHMNDDHTDDSLVITRAFADPAAEAATMAGFDGDVTTWDVVADGVSRSVTIPWLDPVVERADVRRGVVALYDAAVEKLGLPQREAH